MSNFGEEIFKKFHFMSYNENPRPRWQYFLSHKKIFKGTVSQIAERQKKGIFFIFIEKINAYVHNY